MPSIGRPYLLAGVAAATLMITVTTVDGFLRPEYSLTRHWISHLSLGDQGWLGVANLVACGVLLATFGLGLREISRWGGRLLVLAGAALVVAGLFPVDPGLGYPPGASAGPTTSGSVHDAAAGVLFLGLIAAAVVLGRAVGRRGAGIAVGVIVAASFAACSVLVALDYAGIWPSAPSGLLERIALFTGLAWPVVAAGRWSAVPVDVPRATTDPPTRHREAR
jgi:hypothetical membrane protein